METAISHFINLYNPTVITAVCFIWYRREPFVFLLDAEKYKEKIVQILYSFNLILANV
jgi:hypothetical protein